VVPSAAPGSLAECRQRLNELDRELAVLVKEAQSLIAEGCNPIPTLQKFVAYYQEESALLERIQQLQPSETIARVYRHTLAMWESSQFLLANRIGHNAEIQEAVECALAEVQASQLSSEQWRQFWTQLDALQRPTVPTLAPLTQLPPPPAIDWSRIWAMISWALQIITFLVLFVGFCVWIFGPAIGLILLAGSFFYVFFIQEPKR